MGKASTYYTGLPSWAKGVLAVSVVAAIGGLVYVIYKKSKDIKEDKPSKEALDAAVQEANVLQNAGVKPTQTPLVYQTTANTIAKLLNGCETFQSEYQVVEEVAKCVRNKMDWVQLVKAFGTKKIDTCGSFGMSSDMYDLPTLLKDQLDTMNTVNTLNVNGFKKTFYTTDTKDILAEYLKSKGVVL